MVNTQNKKKLILWFKETTINDVPLVGGKNASLGEMYSTLSKKGVSIPNGFSITATAYRYLLGKSGIKKEIRRILKDLDTTNMKSLAEKGEAIRNLIVNASFPKDLENKIYKAYHKLSEIEGTKEIAVAVRSSATAEDLPDASFAGQQETYLNIRGEEALLDACKHCFASLFTNRAISYRVDKKFDHFKIALSIGVQRMVRSDVGSSGVMFSLDTETGFSGVVVINSAYGLGENVVQGAVTPDEFYVFKDTLKKGYKSIITKKIGEKAIKMIYNNDRKKPTKNVSVDIKDRQKLSINDEQVLQLAKWGMIIEDHYSKKAGHYKPMDMEWALDGITKKIFIVQARPETVQSRKNRNEYVTYTLLAKLTEREKNQIITGRSIGQKIASGKANIILNVKDISKFKKGEILVTPMTDPDWEPIMKIASGIVTNKGGVTCHAAIIARELGIPCIVGTGDGTSKIKSGEGITIDCSSGDKGFVYKGSLKFEKHVTSVSNLPKTKTKIMMNVGDPDQAFELSFLPNDGVGLAREEFIINFSIQIHPLALLNYNKIKDKKIKNEIDKLTMGYTNKSQFFIDALAHGIARIGAAFYPKKVILRLSDFKTDEYANLIGGRLYEPIESNPMIGWRGASRYYQGNYRDGFALECLAIKKVREEFGLTNIQVMVPFCRTIDEAKKVITELSKNGLKQGENGLKIIGMCEIPSNVILADKFLDIFDGFSIGSNDLTQLTLGLDRNSEILANIYDERNEAVKQLIREVIKIAKKKKKYIGLCGQAPSDYPEFAEFLVDCGIESMSLNPDTVVKTTLLIDKTEKKLKKK